MGNICLSALGGTGADIGFNNDDRGAGDGRRQALNIFQIDANFKRVVYKKNTKTREFLMEKIHKHPLFETLGKKELGEVVDSMQSVNVARNQALINRGDPMNEMYILESGELTGIRLGKKGRPDKTRVFEPGAILGDKALLSEQTSQASVQCSASATALVWAIDGGTYRNVLAANGERMQLKAKIRAALSASPALALLPAAVADRIAEACEKPLKVAAGQPLPKVTPKQPANELFLVVKGQVRETLALRLDGGEDLTKASKRRRPNSVNDLAKDDGARDGKDVRGPGHGFDASQYVPALNRAFEAGEGELVGAQPVVSGLPSHVSSAAAGRGGAEVLPLPLALFEGHLDKAGALATSLCERVLATKPEFAAFPQAVLSLVCKHAPVLTYRAGECVMRQGDHSKFLFVVRLGRLALCHADVTIISSSSSLAAQSKGGQDIMAKGLLSSPSRSMSSGGHDNPVAESPSSPRGGRLQGRMENGGGKKGAAAGRRGSTTGKKGGGGGDNDGDTQSERSGRSGGGGKKRGESNSTTNSSTATTLLGKNATEAEYLAALDSDLAHMVGDPLASAPPRLGPASVDGDQVRNRLEVGDTLGVGLMKPLDAAAAAAVAKGGKAATQVKGAASASTGGGGVGGSGDGSERMSSTLVAVTRCEVMVLSREVFMKCLNASRVVLKRRQRDKEKVRAQSVAAAGGEAAAARASMRASAYLLPPPTSAAGGNSSAAAAAKSQQKQLQQQQQQQQTQKQNQNQKQAPGGAVEAAVEVVAQEGGAQDADDAFDDALAAVNGGAALGAEWPWQSRPDIKLSNLREVTRDGDA
jgi:CRP-like cAMP-binding protein